ncbi:hypothetical protein [Pseudoxanthomonas taiwanensis]|jgi:hypothetical protein|uniref:Uncharacterized protein n=1 Tax=Pseudoxanthomonas taiwanensis TaxID=176598 RepID=A0A921NW86_9GAMM|nr:hypothetical protein [Pseudoxanthomonas taiwanensis]KAF1685291.1 hypothetical protein CR938_13010 [Pseudoxanthomonas taiwanensis]MBO2466857.1 hypothetical protein [Xanthomonadaceae bacterium]
MTYDTWWLATLGQTLYWARLRVREAGTAQVLDHNGTVHSYDSEDSARSMLLDAGYVEFGGMDEDDALERGFSLAELSPPQADSDTELVGRMTVTLGHRT